MANPKININEATQTQLMRLPRIGAYRASRILKSREENGPFKDSDDLMFRTGFSEALIDELVPYLEEIGTQAGRKTAPQRIHLP